MVSRGGRDTLPERNRSTACLLQNCMFPYVWVGYPLQGVFLQEDTKSWGSLEVWSSMHCPGWKMPLQCLGAICLLVPSQPGPWGCPEQIGVCGGVRAGGLALACHGLQPVILPALLIYGFQHPTPPPEGN